MREAWAPSGRPWREGPAISTHRSTLVLYRSAQNAAVLTTLAASAVGGGSLHAHGPALHGDHGDETAELISLVAARRGVTAMVWDGDYPQDLASVQRLARDTAASLLVIEWQPAVAGGDALGREVLANPPCNLLLVRPGLLSDISEVAVAIGPGPNAPLLASFAMAWAAAFDVRARSVHRVASDDDVHEGRLLCKRVAPELDVEIAVGRDLTNLLAEVAARTGFVALGATEHVAVDRVAARTGAGQLARRAAATIVIGRTAVAAAER